MWHRNSILEENIIVKGMKKQYFRNYKHCKKDKKMNEK
jgi:hypothetical protein